MKLYINPTYNGPDKADGGIRRVIEAMVKHLPSHGITIVDSEEEADILNYHAASYTEYKNKPMVASCHGLYWTSYDWPDYYYQANQAVIEVMARAQAVTAPSIWVKKAIARGILHDPHVVYHGIDTDFWAPVPTTKLNHNYVLWNKARADIISNPDDLNKIASHMQKTKFLTTIGKTAVNVDVMGVVPYPQMVGAIKNAGVYLATARETFGIGTLEALAAGVPVAGWDFGGQSEIIKHGETGYLAPYGDYGALKQCIYNCFTERARLSKNARVDALERWKWEDKIAQYAAIFWQTYTDWYKPQPKYSVIVPAYNLANYLPDALESVKAQSTNDYECIIIDDCSTDHTEQIGRDYAQQNGRFTYHKTPQNSGLCNVRNYGYKVANGRYVLYLDADDKITPEALETLGAYLDNTPAAHIAYGRIDFMNHSGDQYKEGDKPRPFNWLKQICHLHQFPIGAALIRKEALERSGGFRVRDWRAEDAAWIARVTSLGIRAYKATDDPILVYRLHPHSKSQKEARQNPNDIDGNWLSWLGWGLASNRKDGERTAQIGKVPPWRSVPFGAQHPPPKHWNTDHHQEPLVSVIIPVGPGHKNYLIDSLDSLVAQPFPYWEAIVVNDSGEPLDLSFAPYATIIDTPGGKGAGYARNRGAEAARAPLLYFLDCDDWLIAGGLDAMIRGYIEQEGSKYIYSNYIDINQNGRIKEQKMKPYNQKQWRAQHAVNILIHKDHFWKVGGFDDTMNGWEDWDLPLKLAISGICGHHINDFTFVYRLYSGKLREYAVSKQSEKLEQLRARYGPYYEGGQLKMAKCCGGNETAVKAILKARAAYGDKDAQTALSVQPVQRVESVRMEYTGGETGTRTFTRVNGIRLNKTYRGSASPSTKYINAHPQDVKLLEATNLWRIVPRIPNPVAQITAVGAPPINLDPPPKPPADPISVFTPPPPPPKIEIEITAAAKKLADENGININTLKGTGKNGKIVVTDVRGVL